MDQFFNALPEELQAVIGESTIYTDNVGNGTGNVASNVTATKNKIFYLSESGIYGIIQYSNTCEANFQKQLKAYINGMDKVHYKHDNPNTAAYVFLRSPWSSSSNFFVLVNTDGSAGSNYPSVSRGAAPAFAIF